VLVAIGIVVIFAFITLQLMVLIIQYYFFLNAGVVMMGFLGHEWSREYGINYFKLMIGLGVKYLTMQLIIVLTLDITQGWLKESDLTWTQLIIILPTMIIIWGLIREVPQMAQSLVSGSDQTTGNAVAGAMQAAAAMAAIAAGAFAAAGGGAGMAQGAGNMSQLLQGAWNEASGGEGGGGDDDEASTNESDPATGTSPDSASSDSGGDDGAQKNANDPAQSGSPSEASSSADNGSSDNASGNAGSSSAPNKGFAATAALAAGIAGKAIGNELKGSAKNAFKSGMSKFTAPFSTPSNSVMGRAAQSIKSRNK